MDKETDPLNEQFKNISRGLRQYIEKRIDLVKFNISARITRLLAQSIHMILGILLLLGAIFMLLVAGALSLGDYLGNESLGYLIVGVPVLFIAMTLIALKPKSLSDSLQHKFMKGILKSLDDSDRWDEKDRNKTTESRQQSTETKKES